MFCHNTIAVIGPHFKQTVAGILSVDTLYVRHTLNYLLCLYNNNKMDNIEGTLLSIITYTNNSLTCYAKKVCINLTSSMYACLVCLPLFLSIVCIRNCISFDLQKYHYTSQITLSLLTIALYVSNNNNNNNNNRLYLKRVTHLVTN